MNYKFRTLFWYGFLLVASFSTLWACSPVPAQLDTAPPDLKPAHSEKSSPQVIELRTLISDLLTDIRYATANNFTGQVLYESDSPYLVREAAESLVVVQNELKALGLQLLVFDGYRPLSVQKKMWTVFPDNRYVANPANGSRHNRGCAIDLALADSSGNPLEMPTDYDDFTEKAHASYMDLPAQQVANRALLKVVMEKHGFTGLRTEWWHFDFQGWRQYPLLDIPIPAQE
ncbi:MAG: M15 family metallopeptidase [Lentisphaeria bacterium]|nr:M15 family metallopeptidase [Candidatus Neomarinimicrobiota bacterium]MCF7841525.1 M15 family metallopeptidase [Lentisphaeria bacterium]